MIERAAVALVLACTAWTALAVDWSQRVPGAADAFVASALAVGVLLVPAAVLAAEAARPLLHGRR